MVNVWPWPMWIAPLLLKLAAAPDWLTSRSALTLMVPLMALAPSAVIVPWLTKGALIVLLVTASAATLVSVPVPLSVTDVSVAVPLLTRLWSFMASLAFGATFMVAAALMTSVPVPL